MRKAIGNVQSSKNVIPPGQEEGLPSPADSWWSHLSHLSV